MKRGMNRLLFALSLFVLAACGPKPPGGPGPSGGGPAGGGTGSTAGKAWGRLLYTQNLTLDITATWAGQELNPGDGMPDALCAVQGNGSAHAERVELSTFPGSLNNLGNPEGGDIAGQLSIVEVGMVTAHSEETSSNCNPQMSNAWDPCLADDATKGMAFGISLLAGTAQNPLEAKVTNEAIANPVAKAAQCARLSASERAIDLTAELASTAEGFRDSTMPRPVEFKGTKPWKFTNPDRADAVIEGTLAWSLKFELVAKPPP